MAVPVRERVMICSRVVLEGGGPGRGAVFGTAFS